MPDNRNAVNEHFRFMCNGIESDEYFLTLPFFRSVKSFSVARYHLVFMSIEIIKRRDLNSVRDPHVLHVAFFIRRLNHLFIKLFSPKPAVIKIDPHMVTLRKCHPIFSMVYILEPKSG